MQWRPSPASLSGCLIFSDQHAEQHHLLVPDTGSQVSATASGTSFGLMLAGLYRGITIYITLTNLSTFSSCQ